MARVVITIDDAGDGGEVDLRAEFDPPLERAEGGWDTEKFTGAQVVGLGLVAHSKRDLRFLEYQVGVVANGDN